MPKAPKKWLDSLCDVSYSLESAASTPIQTLGTMRNSAATTARVHLPQVRLAGWPKPAPRLALKPSHSTSQAMKAPMKAEKIGTAFMTKRLAAKAMKKATRPQEAASMAAASAFQAPLTALAKPKKPKMKAKKPKLAATKPSWARCASAMVV